MALLKVRVAAVSKVELGLLKLTVPLPSELLFVMIVVPLGRTMPPVEVFVPLKVIVPVPVRNKDPDPLTAPENVLDPVTLIVSAEPGSSIRLELEFPFKLPIVKMLATSKVPPVIVTGPVMLPETLRVPEVMVVPPV